MKLNSDFINEYLKGIFKPGAVLVSYGMRGGGKTHCAVSYCQRLIEGYYPDCPKHVVLITNVIFVKKSRKGFVSGRVYHPFHEGDISDRGGNPGEVR